MTLFTHAIRFTNFYHEILARNSFIIGSYKGDIFHLFILRFHADTSFTLVNCEFSFLLLLKHHFQVVVNTEKITRVLDNFGYSFHWQNSLIGTCSSTLNAS